VGAARPTATSLWMSSLVVRRESARPIHHTERSAQRRPRHIRATP